MAELIEIHAPEWLVFQTDGEPEVIELPAQIIELLEIAEQGPAGAAGAQGIPGPAGGSSMEFTATTAIGGHRVLALDAANAVVYAENTAYMHSNKIIGISLNAAAPGGTISAVRAGEVAESSWSWDVTLPVYLGVNGLLTQTPPVYPAAFSLIVGFPTAPDRLFVAVREPITLT